jgi:tRNA 2-thiouridine synthesizing protein B
MSSFRRSGTSTSRCSFEVRSMADLFLLTKAPREPRSELCFELMEHSENPKLYLAGDGVYHLLNRSALSAWETLACREDILARGLPLTDDVAVPDDFYRQLVTDMMENSDHVYVF